MDQSISAPLFTGVLFVAMLVALEVGRVAGLRHIKRDPSKEPGVSSIEAAVFAMFGLLLAFTFSGAGARFDSRRKLIADEANAIGTAYLRLDLLPADSQPALRGLFREYVGARQDVYRSFPDLTAVKAALARSEKLQARIWGEAVAASRAVGVHVDGAKLLLPALNEMIDITTTRTMAARTHPPRQIYGLLFAFGISCTLLAGYGLAGRKTRSWFHILGFSLATAVVVFVIVDLEYPRRGVLRLDAYDQVLAEVLERM